MNYNQLPKMSETDIVFRRKFEDGTNFGNPQIIDSHNLNKTKRGEK